MDLWIFNRFCSVLETVGILSEIINRDCPMVLDPAYRECLGKRNTRLKLIKEKTINSKTTTGLQGSCKTSSEKKRPMM